MRRVGNLHVKRLARMVAETSVGNAAHFGVDIPLGKREDGVMQDDDALPAFCQAEDGCRLRFCWIRPVEIVKNDGVVGILARVIDKDI